MSTFGDLFSSEGVIGQLLIWQLGGQIFAAVLNPALTASQQEIWAGAINSGAAGVYVVPSPADLADQVTRGIRDLTSATGEAAKSGMTGDDFASAVAGAGEPPALETVLEMYRRGFIGWDGVGDTTTSVANAIAKGRTYTYWTDALQACFDPAMPGGGTPLSPGEAVNAALRGQAPTDQMATEAAANGVNADRFQILLDTAGNPPSPTQLVEFVRRGFIPLDGVGPDVLSFEQGIYEGDSKDKWQPIFQKLVDYIPPPRTVMAMLRTGAMPQSDANGYLQDFGLSPALAAIYIQSINGEKMAGTKQLAQGVVLELYEAQAIDATVATGYLNVLGYTDTQAAFLLEVYDLRREINALNKAISRVGALYVAHKVTRTAAVEFLGELGVTGDHLSQMMATWDLAAAAEVRLPTISEIGKAVYYGAISAAEALTEAQRLGYSPYDAYIALSAAAEAPVGTNPGNTPPAPPGTV